MTDRLDGLLLRERRRAAAVGTHTGEKVGFNGNIALRRNLVGHQLGPVRETEDFVDYEDDGALVFRLRIDDERLDLAMTVFHGGPFQVTRRLVEPSAGPFLSRSRAGAEQNHDCSQENGGQTSHVYRLRRIERACDDSGAREGWQVSAKFGAQAEAQRPERKVPARGLICPRSARRV